MRIGTVAVLAVFLLLDACPGPTYQPLRLEAIRAESEGLMAARTFGGDIPKSAWPPAIASVNPEYVFVGRSTVFIIVVPFFDGGWGYEVTPRKENLGMLPECYEQVHEGVFWHGPC